MFLSHPAAQLLDTTVAEAERTSETITEMVGDKGVDDTVQHSNRGRKHIRIMISLALMTLWQMKHPNVTS